jgi:hypothetical protein
MLLRDHGICDFIFRLRVLSSLRNFIDQADELTDDAGRILDEFLAR